MPSESDRRAAQDIVASVSVVLDGEFVDDFAERIARAMRPERAAALAAVVAAKRLALGVVRQADRQELVGLMMDLDAKIKAYEEAEK